jgi:hypothetical protein
MEALTKRQRTNRAAKINKGADAPAIRAGGYNAISGKTQRKNFMQKKSNVQSSNLVAAGVQMGTSLEANQLPMAHTQYEHNQFGKFNKKKTTPAAGGFRINIKKKKKKAEEMRMLKNIDVDIHDRWIKDPVVAEVLKKHEEEIKKAGHKYNDQPITQIIPKSNIK